MLEAPGRRLLGTAEAIHGEETPCSFVETGSRATHWTAEAIKKRVRTNLPYQIGPSTSMLFVFFGSTTCCCVCCFVSFCFRNSKNQTVECVQTGGTGSRGVRHNIYYKAAVFVFQCVVVIETTVVVLVEN